MYSEYGKTPQKTHISILNLDRQAWADNEDPDQTPKNADNSYHPNRFLQTV